MKRSFRYAALLSCQLRQAIVAALGRDPAVGCFAFNVVVRRGLVYVYGRVNRPNERIQVGAVIDRFPGAIVVDNQVEIDDPGVARAEQATNRALAACIRRRRPQALIFAPEPWLPQSGQGPGLAPISR